MADPRYGGPFFVMADLRYGEPLPSITHAGINYATLTTDTYRYIAYTHRK